MPNPNNHHHDGGRAERQRLADRACAALRDLAELDPNVIEISTIAATELDALYPGAKTNAGPTDPPPDPPKKP